MPTAAEQAAQAEADFQQVVRVATYAIEDLPNLDRETWFKHDNVTLSHDIVRNGEAFTFEKTLFSRIKPTFIGYELHIPLSTGMSTFAIYVRDPVEDTAVNRRAASRALERFTTIRNLRLVEVSTNDLK